MRRLAERLLQLAADEEIELLVVAAEFDIGLEGNRVIALGEGVEEFVNRDGGVIGVAFGEVVPLEDAGHGVVGAETDDVFELHAFEPAGVEVHFRLFGIEDFEDLRFVGFGVAIDVFAGERGAGEVATGRVADEAGHVADQEDDLMAEVLEVLHLPEQYGMAQMKIGGGGVEPSLHTQRAAQFEPLSEILFPDHFREAFAKVGDLFVDRNRSHFQPLLRTGAPLPILLVYFAPDLRSWSLRENEMQGGAYCRVCGT